MGSVRTKAPRQGLRIFTRLRRGGRGSCSGVTAPGCRARGWATRARKPARLAVAAPPSTQASSKADRARARFLGPMMKPPSSGSMKTAVRPARSKASIISFFGRGPLVGVALAGGDQAGHGATRHAARGLHQHLQIEAVGKAPLNLADRVAGEGEHGFWLGTAAVAIEVPQAADLLSWTGTQRHVTRITSAGEMHGLVTVDGGCKLRWAESSRLCKSKLAAITRGRRNRHRDSICDAVVTPITARSISQRTLLRGAIPARRILRREVTESTTEESSERRHCLFAWRKKTAE